MAGNSVTLEFAGDAAKLQRAAKQSTSALDDVGQASQKAGKDLKAGGQAADDFTGKMGKLGAGMTGTMDAVNAAGDAVTAFADLSQAGAERASRLARATTDVAQAQEDMAQSTRDASQSLIDGKQAEVDLETARLDQAETLKAYNLAVDEHGAKSTEARRAQVELKQAGLDVEQAQEDAAQAIRDGSQAAIDATSAQNDLNDAQREADPSKIKEASDAVAQYTPLLTGLIGVMGLVTAAQWAWNAAQFASPTTWIILAIIGIIALIVLLVVKWDWVKEKGAAAWDWIKKQASKFWDWLKDLPGKIKNAFVKIGDWISAPFRNAFNRIADAWNNTIGRLSWTVPAWVPYIGGNSISVPRLPKFHAGGTVPGPAGSEMLAILQAGERVIPASQNDGVTHVVVQIDRDTLLDVMAKGVRRGGPRVA